MDYQQGHQLSLIAEDFGCESEVGDWSVDTKAIPLGERSIEDIRSYFVRSVGGKHGGQNENSTDKPPKNLPPIRETAISECPPHGGQIKNSLFDRNEGDPGTWVEKERRGIKIYRYLRWREHDGSKPSKYLGVGQ